MKVKLQEYFDHYAKAHGHAGNRFCHTLGIPTILISLFLILFTAHKREGWILFGIGWGFQILGHVIERSRPEFLDSPIYLIIGPLYFFNKLLKKVRKTPENRGGF